VSSQQEQRQRVCLCVCVCVCKVKASSNHAAKRGSEKFWPEFWPTQLGLLSSVCCLACICGPSRKKGVCLEMLTEVKLSSASRLATRLCTSQWKLTGSCQFAAEQVQFHFSTVHLELNSPKQSKLPPLPVSSGKRSPRIELCSSLKSASGGGTKTTPLCWRGPSDPSLPRTGRTGEPSSNALAAALGSMVRARPMRRTVSAASSPRDTSTAELAVETVRKTLQTAHSVYFRLAARSEAVEWQFRANSRAGKSSPQLASLRVNDVCSVASVRFTSAHLSSAQLTSTRARRAPLLSTSLAEESASLALSGRRCKNIRASIMYVRPVGHFRTRCLLSLAALL